MTPIATNIRKILLIDDDKDDCEIFLEILNEVAGAVELACLNDSADVLANIVYNRPDLIFMDLNMPKKSGIDCLKEVRTAGAEMNVPIVIISSSQNPKDIAQAYDQGATLYFVKPSRYGALRQGIEQILQMDWSRPEAIKEEYTCDDQHRHLLIR